MFNKLLLFILILGIPVTFKPDINNGKELYIQNCIMCHLPTTELIGPPLKGVSDKRNKDWLIQMIKNGDKLIENQDSLAMNLYFKYDKVKHPSFDHLTDKEIRSIIKYMNSF